MDRPRIVVTLAVAARQAEPDIAARKNAPLSRRHRASRRRADRPRRDRRPGCPARGVRDDGRPADLGRGGPRPRPLWPAEPRLGQRRGGPRPARGGGLGGGRRRAACPCSASAAGSRRSTSSPGAASSRTSPATSGPPGGTARRRCTRCGSCPGSRLARILSPARVVGATEVNTYHHQGVRAADLAPGLVASAWASSPAGDLVEGFEAADGRFVLGVQCHPERQESTPAEFERLWSVFVDACRGPLAARGR